MDPVMKTRIVKIGNSQGIRIPKLLLDQLGFGTEVEVVVQQNQLVIRPLQHPRSGWEDQFRLMAERGDDELLDGDIVSLSSWDDEEWEW
jgi:antitoxin MazE